MMIKKQKQIYFAIISLVLLVSVYVYVYQPFWHGNKRPLSLSYYENTGLFMINPETILTSLENGNTDAFQPDIRTWDDVYSEPILYDQLISWSQSDNLKIVHALDDFIWKDSLDEWNFYAMYFNVDCQDNFIGFPGGGFVYLKVNFEKGKIVDTWREVYIDPEYGFVAWGDEEKYPHPFLGRNSIDLSQVKITAEDAIRIAEENGGKEARLGLQNRCSIHLYLRPQSYDGWVVDYGYSSGFKILIDPYTGKVIQLLRPI